MALPNLFKLEKLRIVGYRDRARKRPLDFTGLGIEVMFNPTSFNKKHAIKYTRTPALNESNSPSDYVYSGPGEVSFKLVFDGTGVTLMGIYKAESVKSRIKKFEEMCLTMNGDIHQPNFLKIVWGDHLGFWGRLQTLDIAYKLFDEGGDPLYAELDVTFVEDMSGETIALKEGKSSPDVTHLRVVKSGDTLPLLCKEIYGSSSHYLRVAADNGLDDFRNLVPGQELRFAPLK